MNNLKFPIIDLHTDYVMTLSDKGDYFHTSNQISYPQIIDTNVKLIFSGYSYDDIFGDTADQLKLLENEFALKKFNLISKGSDLTPLFDLGDTLPSMLLHLEGAKVLGKNVRNLTNLYQKGLRSIGLTHNHANQLATGCLDGNLHGLTAFGKKIVHKANSLNMVIDASHINHKGFYDLLSLSTSPVIVTHGNAAKLCPHPRNFSDQQIKDLSKQGGVIGLFFSAKFVNPITKKANINDMVNHCLHIADVGGINVLSLGTDFGGITTGTIKGLENLNCLPVLFSLLHKAGFSNSDLEQICYKNAFSVIQKILSD